MEKLIFENLIFNGQYGRKALPFLKEEYFKENKDRVVYNLIKNHIDKYNNFPSVEALRIELGSLSNISKEDFDSANTTLSSLNKEEKELKWLLDKTEQFCQDKALYNALMKSIQVVNDDKSSISKGGIPQLLSDALAVSFDNSVGHDFIDDADDRYEFYHKKEKKFPFDIDYLNKITGGGLPSKTLNVILAGTGVGKSLAMCHMAAFNLHHGLNVLYITMEMSEERIAERIDSNLLDIPIQDLRTTPKATYDRKIEKLKETTKGKFIIKEYPTASAGSSNFRYLLNELKLKKNFKPDIIYIDYLNICMSSRLKMGANVNSYTYVKTIAEEIRGLAVEFDVPIVSATQVNRSGFSDSDFGLENTSESFGLPATVDLMFALISTEELEKLNQIMVKQLKNRYNDVAMYKRFVVGIDKTKMRLYNVEYSAQNDVLNDDRPVFDKSDFGEEIKNRKSKFNKKSFEDFI